MSPSKPDPQPSRGVVDEVTNHLASGDTEAASKAARSAVPKSGSKASSSSSTSGGKGKKK